MKIDKRKKNKVCLPYKAGDVVEMNYGIKPQRVVKIISKFRVRLSDMKTGEDSGITPTSWVKGKLKKKRTKKLPKK